MRGSQISRQLNAGKDKTVKLLLLLLLRDLPLVCHSSATRLLVTPQLMSVVSNEMTEWFADTICDKLLTVVISKTARGTNVASRSNDAEC